MVCHFNLFFDIAFSFNKIVALSSFQSRSKIIKIKCKAGSWYQEIIGSVVEFGTKISLPLPFSTVGDTPRIFKPFLI